MDNRQQSGKIDQTVEALPVSPQAPHPSSSRSDSQGEKREESGEPDQGVAFLEDGFLEKARIETIIETHEGQEMKRSIQERVQTEGLAQADHLPQAEQSVERRTSQSQDEQY